MYFLFVAIWSSLALINVAFTKGDDGWRLAWIESRLQYIESAENMSHQIPGFRQAHNWFPKQIYFSATPQQVREYREKYHPRDKFGGTNADGDVTVGGWARNGDDEGDDEVDPIFENVPRDAPEDEEEQQDGEGEGEGEGEGQGKDGGDERDGAATEGENEEGSPTEEHQGGEGSKTDATAGGDQKEEVAEIVPEPESQPDQGTAKEEKRLHRGKTVKATPATVGSSDGAKAGEKSDKDNTKIGQGTVQDLRAQVGDLQKQLTLQQEQSQKQFDELKELLLRATAKKK